MAAALALTALPAAAQEVEVPTSASGSGSAAAPPPPAAAPAPAATPAPAPATAAAPATPATAAPTPVVLRIGSVGAQVKDLQRELRRRGMKISVDGAYGPATKRAVKKMQKRFKMKVTGVADAKLLKRLGLRIRAAAAAPTPLVVTKTILPGASQYLDIFPLSGEYQYSDDYGAPRHQGRHEGVDIMADRDTPIVAVVNGTVERLARTETGLGGIYVWLKRADGTEYYYAHMASIADGLDAGSTVMAGQVIGGVGNTGDARYGATHLHFEIRPGGSPIDPYPHLVSVDPTRK